MISKGTHFTICIRFFMSLCNTSQLLLRNRELLHATAPLFINFSCESLFDVYLDEQTSTQISCYNTNFEQYQLLKDNYGARINCVFDACYQSTTTHDLVVIQFPKSKAELNFTLAMIQHCTTMETKILVVGENKGGIKSIDKLTADTLEYCHKVDSARHCVLFASTLKKQQKPFELTQWFSFYDVVIDGITLKVAALPGVFSQSGLDKGTALLLNNLPQHLQGNVLDFGCGAGVIAGFIGKKFNHVSLSLLDVSALALASAAKTLEINELKGNVFASNSLSQVTEKYEHVISNPPFHQGIKTHYVATESFLKGIKRFVIPKGNVMVVANSFLRYQPIMEQALGKTTRVINEKGFTVYQCRC